MFNTLEHKEVWLIQNKETGKIVYSFRTDRGNARKALFPEKAQAADVLEKFIPNKEKYIICRITNRGKK